MYSKDLIAERDKKEKMFKSVIKWWNVHYMTPEEARRAREEKAAEDARRAEEARLALEEAERAAQQALLEEEAAKAEAEAKAEEDAMAALQAAMASQQANKAVDDAARAAFEAEVAAKEARELEAVKANRTIVSEEEAKAIELAILEAQEKYANAKAAAAKAAEERAAAEAIAIEKRMEAEAKSLARAKAEAEHMAATELTRMLQEAYNAAKVAASFHPVEEQAPVVVEEPVSTYDIPIDIRLLIGNLGITDEQFLSVKKDHMDKTDLEVINVIIKGNA